LSKSAPVVSARAAPTVETLPSGASVKALIVGIENYQKQASGALPTVHYAKRDAEAFRDALQEIYGDRLDAEVLLDEQASGNNLKYQLDGFIKSLGKDDLFIFYYAGHGFHGEGGNRITAWDSNAYGVEGTTLLLREVLLDPLSASECCRALAFVDACAANFQATVPSRSVISGFDERELKEFLKATEYFALFLSCSPQEKSYPSDQLKHGIWTHFLLKALRGEDDEALGPGRYLTDESLKNYLRVAVPRYITNEMTLRGTQKPQAMITADGTFAICEIRLPVVVVSDAGDLSELSLLPEDEFFEGVEEGKIQSLDGFQKVCGHSVPMRMSTKADNFVRSLLAERIAEELQDFYKAVKQTFGLKSKDVQLLSDIGVGDIETEFFRYSVTSQQSPDDPAKYRITYQLKLRQAAQASTLAKIDEVFGSQFDELVVETKQSFMDFADLVEKLEDLSEDHGGTVDDEPANELVTYVHPNGASIMFDVASGRIAISATGHSSVSALLASAQQYRFGLTGKSLLLIGV
jgi:hypothetical protein